MSRLLGGAFTGVLLVKVKPSDEEYKEKYFCIRIKYLSPGSKTFTGKKNIYISEGQSGNEPIIFFSVLNSMASYRPDAVDDVKR